MLTLWCVFTLNYTAKVESGINGSHSVLKYKYMY